MLKTSLIRNNLCVKKSPIHGYGVFAGQDFEKDDIIEECYTIFSKNPDICLKNYCFGFGKSDLSALPTGFGVIYNHSSKPNAGYTYDEQYDITIFKAYSPIKKAKKY